MHLPNVMNIFSLNIINSAQYVPLISQRAATYKQTISLIARGQTSISFCGCQEDLNKLKNLICVLNMFQDVKKMSNI